MELLFSYFGAWLAGGVALLTMLLLGTKRRPLWLAFALMGYGGVGIAARALGFQPWQRALGAAIGCAFVLALLGYVLQRLGDQPG